MRQVGKLFGFEMKKILMRKSTWIALGIMVVFYLAQALMSLGYEISHSDGSGAGVYSENELQKIDRERKAGLALSGRKLDAALLWEMGYQLSAGEEAYWQKKEEALEMPFTVQYAGGFQKMTRSKMESHGIISVSDCGIILLMLTFLWLCWSVGSLRKSMPAG